MLSVSHIIKLQKWFSLQIQKMKQPSQSPVVYKFTGRGFSCNYISKIERTLHERTEEHAYSKKKTNEQSAIYETIHIMNYAFLNLPP